MSTQQASQSGTSAQQFLAHQLHLRQQLERRLVPADFFDWQAPIHTIPGRIAEIAGRYPHRPAVLDPTQTLTYRELDQSSNRVANALIEERGPGPEIVSILIGPSVHAMTTALGVLKAGKAYVGFDDAYTEARYRDIIDDTDSRTLIYDHGHADLARRLANGERRPFSIEQLERYPDLDPRVVLTPDTLALLCYSSGSTGKPKGILHSHHSVVGQAACFGALAGLNSSDRVANWSSLAWAASFWYFFGPLFVGASVANINPRHHQVAHVIEWLDDIGVTVLSGRSYLRQLLALAGDCQLNSIRYSQLGGDAVYRRDVLACRRTFPNALVSVGMGTTEAGRSSEWLIDQETPLEEEVIHIGLPSPGVTIRVLDDDGSEVSPGEQGEIAVQSSYLAQGYWQQPELTAARFPTPVGEAFPLYLTGDTGRLRPDGALEHLGRRDFQIKIHDYQIRVTEIEGLLIAAPGVQEACVVKQNEADGHELLIAFITAQADEKPSDEALRSMLAVRLPSYMIPHHIVTVTNLPKTANGKMDRGRMPAFDHVRPPLQTPFVAATTPIEMKLAAIWEGVLDIKPVGVNDPFLSLGGDSLRAAQIVNRVPAEFAVDLAYDRLLEADTVAEMAILIVVAMMGQDGRLTSEAGGRHD